VRREPPGHRHGNSAARFLAPAAFLAAVTIAVLLVRSGLSEGDNAGAPATLSATTTAPAPTTTEAVVLPGTTSAATTGAGEREVVYEIEAGDTLETIAVEFDTTVERLLTLNPGLDPVALRIGEEIRVK
jgi:LysM repeat protein